MQFNFSKHLLSFAAFAACLPMSAATITVNPITLQPGAIFGGVINVTPGDWSGSQHLAGESDLRFTETVFWIERPRDAMGHWPLYPQVSVDSALYGIGTDAGPYSNGVWAYQTGIPERVASYHFTVTYGGDTAATLTLGANVTPNPEPATWLLMAGGLAVLAWRRCYLRNTVQVKAPEYGA